MKLYQCHKQVRAMKIHRIVNHEGNDFVSFESDHDSQHTTNISVKRSFFDRHSAKVGDWYVAYADGYESISPAEAFESGYREISDRPAMLGEPGTEQFTVRTEVDGVLVKQQNIHDPFVSTTVGVRGWQLLWAFLCFRWIKVQVHVRGTQSAQRRIMTMDPVEMQQEEERNSEYAAKLSAGCAQLEAAAQASMGKANQ